MLLPSIVLDPLSSFLLPRPASINPLRRSLSYQVNHRAAKVLRELCHIGGGRSSVIGPDIVPRPPERGDAEGKEGGDLSRRGPRTADSHLQRSPAEWCHLQRSPSYAMTHPLSSSQFQSVQLKSVTVHRPRLSEIIKSSFLPHIHDAWASGHKGTCMHVCKTWKFIPCDTSHGFNWRFPPTENSFVCIMMW